ncbi:hypothetical protein C3Z50_19300 [Salmonella enterica]|nr:hypothetical protein [Salmonella enterica]
MNKKINVVSMVAGTIMAISVGTAMAATPTHTAAEKQIGEVTAALTHGDEIGVDSTQILPTKPANGTTPVKITAPLDIGYIPAPMGLGYW